MVFTVCLVVPIGSFTTDFQVSTTISPIFTAVSTTFFALPIGSVIIHLALSKLFSPIHSTLFHISDKVPENFSKSHPPVFVSF